MPARAVTKRRVLLDVAVLCTCAVRHNRLSSAGLTDPEHASARLFPSSAMQQVFIYVVAFLAVLTVPGLGHCCGFNQADFGCCNIFNCNCDGPCWNNGCKTACDKNRPVECPAVNGDYSCCQAGQECKPNCNYIVDATCCCTEDSYVIIEIGDLNYDMGRAFVSQSVLANQIWVVSNVTNSGPENQNTGAISQELKHEQTSKLQWSEGLIDKFSGTVKVGAAPFILGGEVTMGNEKKHWLPC